MAELGVGCWWRKTGKSSSLSQPPNHRLSQLIAEDEHRKGEYLGVAANVARMRCHFWITNLQRLVKRIFHKCIVCKRQLQRLSGQVMGSLPLAQPSPPFYTVGIDFFGPITIKVEEQERVRRKCRWCQQGLCNWYLPSSDATLLKYQRLA